MVKGILYLIQYLVLISTQTVSQIGICNDLNNQQQLKLQVKNDIHVVHGIATKKNQAMKKNNHITVLKFNNGGKTK